MPRAMLDTSQPASTPPMARCRRSKGVVAAMSTPGEIVTLIGANGAGKSTLLMTVCGQPARAHGRDPLRRRGHHATPTHDIMRRGMAQSPEGRRIFPRMTVLENLLMGADGADPAHPAAQTSSRSSPCFPVLKERAQASAAARCRAASSRCWRSAGR